MADLLRLFREQQAAVVAVLEKAHSSGETRVKVAESFKALKLPEVKEFRQWKEALRKAVIEGIPSKFLELTKWWNEIDEAFKRHEHERVAKRADEVVAELADSGEFTEWDIKICSGGYKTIVGTPLEKLIAE